MRFYTGNVLREKFGGIPLRSREILFSKLFRKDGIYIVSKFDEAVIKEDYNLARKLLGEEGGEVFRKVEKTASEVGQPLNLNVTEGEVFESSVVDNYIASRLAERERLKNRSS